jgi:hypothetical protein
MVRCNNRLMDKNIEGPTPIRLFVAITRALREASIAEETKAKAFHAVEALADHCALPEFGMHLDVLSALLTTHDELDKALRPYMPALRALETRLQVNSPLGSDAILAR